MFTRKDHPITATYRSAATIVPPLSSLGIDLHYLSGREAYQAPKIGKATTALDPAQVSASKMKYLRGRSITLPQRRVG